MPKKHVISLSAEDHTTLEKLLNKGKISARVLKRAHILRMVAAGKSDAEIVMALGVGEVSIYRTRKRYLEGGLERALYEKPRPGNPRRLDEVGEATLVALSCADTPHGEERWTLRMLAERLVELQVVDNISADTVGRVLKKTHSSRGGSNTGVSRR
jgi:transposase